jgi:hypothetical protein
MTQGTFLDIMRWLAVVTACGIVALALVVVVSEIADSALRAKDDRRATRDYRAKQSRK